MILIKIPICQKLEPEIRINEHGCEPDWAKSDEPAAPGEPRGGGQIRCQYGADEKAATTILPAF